VRIAVLACVLVAGALAPPVAAAQPQQQLSFADDAGLKIEVDNDEKTASDSVVLVNSGPKPSQLSFTAVSQDSDASTITVEPTGSTTVPANGAARIDLSFISDDSLDGFTGHLVATGDGAAAERDVTFDVSFDSRWWVNAIIFGSLLFAGVLTLWRAVKLRGRLGHRLATPNWDFSKSWASTFTVVGALLGTILSSVAFPESPERFSKETLAGMNLLFGVAILVAPFLFSETERARLVMKDGASQVQAHGTVAGYLRACALTLTGVVGELVTVFFLLAELQSNGALPDEGLILLGVLLAIAWALVAVYAWKTMGWIALNATPPDDTQDDLETTDTALIPAPAYSPPLL
jgi:hypothetical protein